MSTKKNFRKIYDNLASVYDIVYGGFLARGLDLAVAGMKLKAEMDVLEIGIGTGLSLPLFPKKTHVVGIDVSQAMLDMAKTRVKELKMPNVELRLMGAERLEFKDATFDRVFAPSVFSVMHNPSAALDEMIRVCRSDGLICIVSHFTGESTGTRFLDTATNPFTQRFLGFRMNTPRNIIENHSGVEIVLKKNVYPLNFSTLYILKKKNRRG